MKPKTIFVLGNELLKEDSIALKLKKDLQKIFPGIQFKEFDANEELPKTLIFLDSVLGTKKALVITDEKMISAQNTCSVHDFDLGLTLKLLKKIRKINEFKIIGIPAGMNKKKALNETKKIIQSLV